MKNKFSKKVTFQKSYEKITLEKHCEYAPRGQCYKNFYGCN
jgi:hypothetical protein